MTFKHSFCFNFFHCFLFVFRIIQVSFHNSTVPKKKKKKRNFQLISYSQIKERWCLTGSALRLAAYTIGLVCAEPDDDRLSGSVKIDDREQYVTVQRATDCLGSSPSSQSSGGVGGAGGAGGAGGVGGSGSPGSPGTSGSPGSPGRPKRPEIPEIPEIPKIYKIPKIYEIPEISETSEIPEKFKRPERPVSYVRSGDIPNNDS